MSPVRLYEALALLVAFLLMLGAAALKGYHMGEASVEARYQAKEIAAQESEDRALKAAAEALRTMAPAQARVIERITHETTQPVYVGCRNTVDGLRDINAALTNSEPAGDQPMPSASAPH